MKYHRIGTQRVITRDSIPALILSESSGLTDSAIEKLQCLTLTSDTSLWVNTQNRRIPVRSGYHLISALRYEDPIIQLSILGCREIYDVMTILQDTKDKQSPKFKANFKEVARYVFSMLIMHSFQECRYILGTVGKQDIGIAYNTISGSESIGTSTTDFNIFKGKNILGSILHDIAKEFANDYTQFLKIEPLADFALLGSPLRPTKRVEFSDDAKSQPRERVMASLGMISATKSKLEKYLED